MSTDNVHSQDETPPVDFSSTLPVAGESPAVDSQTAASAPGEAPSTDVPSAERVAGNSESAGPPVVQDAGNEDGPRRKLQLRPMLNVQAVRPVPTYGDTSARSSAESGPVPVPPADDADVQSAMTSAVLSVSDKELNRTVPGPQEPVALPPSEAIDASIEAAIEAAMSGSAEAVADLPATPAVSAPIDVETLQPGQKLRGTIQAVHGDSVFLDFGLRLTGAVPFRQFDPKKPPVVGESVEVVLDRVDDAEGLILGNLPRGTSKIKGGNWDAVSPDQIVECLVTKTNKGGLEVNLGSLRGFIPASQVDLGYVADLQPYVGQKLRARITEVNPAKRKLVLSRRALLVEERESARQELIKEIKADQVRTGRVKTIKDYGAFIDLGGMDGFLPVAQMSWIRIAHPSEVLQEGQQIEVKVLSVDPETQRISLGMRQLAPNPWRTAETKYAKGTVVTGRVTRLEPFGAFVELEPGIEGLVHISELDHRRVKRVSEVLNVDDMAEVQVLEVDPKKKRVSLSVKALKAQPEPIEKPKDEDLAPGKGESYERKRQSPLRGGTGSSKGGGLFGNPRDFAG